MKVKVGLSIGQHCIGFSVFSVEEPSELLYYDAIKYDNLKSNLRYGKFAKLYENREITKFLTTLSLSVLSDIKTRFNEIESINFSLLRTELLFSKELASIRTEKQKVIEVLKRIGVNPSYSSITRFKLWEDLGPDPDDRHCIYSGKKITINNLFAKTVNVDHIVPHSITRDNSLSNMIVCSKASNSIKAAMTPWEKWSNNPEEWSAIISRARKLPIDRLWRFTKDAVEISKYMKEREFYMNTAQLNFSSSLRYLASELDLVKSYNSIDFISPVSVKAVKSGILRNIYPFYEELGGIVSKEERTNIMESIVCHSVSQKCQSQILSFIDRVDKKTFKNEYHTVNFSRHNLNSFVIPENENKTILVR